MPRGKNPAHDALIERAMTQFWQFGYSATSMDHLVASTEVARHGIYTRFGNKHGLFLACLDAYSDTVVSPAFAVVEADNAGLQEISLYFEFQIARAEAAGLPGPGCLMANSMTEIAPHDTATLDAIRAHHRRLHHGFRRVIEREQTDYVHLDASEIEALAEFLVTAAQGLWSMSRIVSDAEPLRRFVRTTIRFLHMRLHP
jgi:TetR/AcrR family transcriptional regulator, transcriptional repressor for nem operon